MRGEGRHKRGKGREENERKGKGIRGKGRE